MPEIPTVVGITVRVPMKVWRDFPELAARYREMGHEQTAARARAAGLIVAGEVHEVAERFVRLVKVAHHEHGWQWEEHECAEADASMVVLGFEVLTR